MDMPLCGCFLGIETLLPGGSGVGSEAHGIFKKPTGVIKIPSQGSIALGRDEPMVGLPARYAGKFRDVVFVRGCQR